MIIFSKIEGKCTCSELTKQVNYLLERACLQGTSYCHCRDCQLNFGMPLISLAAFSFENFSFTNTCSIFEVKKIKSEKYFCINCGTFLFLKSKKLNLIEISTITLNNREIIPHIYQYLP